MLRRFIALLLIPTFLIALGTVGYHVLPAGVNEQYSLFDGLYMTVMTMTTVGFGEVHPLSHIGKAFTIFLMLSGIFTLFYAAGEVIRIVVSGELRTTLGRQLMEQALSRLSQHIIVCGFGRMGRLVCKEFEHERLSYVVINIEEKQLTDFQPKHGIALVGDATSDEILKRAGVERARALVTVAGSDADNLYITMTARLLNNRLYIVARAENEASEQKLQRAGANKVVSPYSIGGHRVANAVLRPTVMDFIELATRSGHLDLQIEETKIGPRSRLVEKTLKDSNLRQQFGIIIVAIKKASGEMVFNPPAEARLDAGDVIISLGKREQLDALDALATG